MGWWRLNSFGPSGPAPLEAARRRRPWSRCPSPCRPAQENPALGLRSHRASRNRRGKEHGPRRGERQRREWIETLGREPQHPGGHTRSYAFANKSPLRRRAPVPPTRAGQGPVPEHDAGRTPAAAWLTGLWSHRSPPPPGGGALPEGPPLRRRCRRRTQAHPADSCGRGRVRHPGSVVGLTDVDPGWGRAGRGSATGGRSETGTGREGSVLEDVTEGTAPARTGGGADGCGVVIAGRGARRCCHGRLPRERGTGHVTDPETEGGRA